MIKLFENFNLRIYLIIFHIILGIVTTFSPIYFILFFYLILFYSSFLLFVAPPIFKKTYFIFLFFYLNSFELLARMALTSPYIPYELSKYLTFLLLLFGIISFKTKGKLGWLLLFLLIPSLFIDVSNSVIGYEPYSFNFLGPLNVALSVILFYDFKISFLTFNNILFYILLACISVLSFTVFKTPDFDKIEFSLASNFETSGGFGSNQVSTVLGLGMFLSFLFLYSNWKISKYRNLDILIFIGFIFQGLLSFSRGGMLGGFLGIIILLFFNFFKGNRKKFKATSLTFIIIFTLPIVFLFVNNLTGGLLLQRYQGETAGTLGGLKEKSLNIATTNRYDIFLGDLELWAQNPLFGVGIGASRILRSKVEDTVAHVEFSRLLAEHGIFGLFYFIILLIYVFNKIRKNKFPQIRIIFLSLFLISIYTTFHAAMRTFVTPLLISISLVSILPISMKHYPRKI